MHKVRYGPYGYFGRYDTGDDREGSLPQPGRAGYIDVIAKFSPRISYTEGSHE